MTTNKDNFSLFLYCLSFQSQFSWILRGSCTWFWRRRATWASVYEVKLKVFVAQSCLTLGSPMDCSPPSSSVQGILQARILEWVAIPFSRGSSCPGIEPRSPTLQADSLLSEPPRKSILNKHSFRISLCNTTQSSNLTLSINMSWWNRNGVILVWFSSAGVSLWGPPIPPCRMEKK